MARLRAPKVADKPVPFFTSVELSKLEKACQGRRPGRVRVYPHPFRHHFSHTWLERGGAEGDLMELNGWSSPQMLQRFGASARARRHYDLVMDD
jgi:integrase